MSYASVIEYNRRLCLSAANSSLRIIVPCVIVQNTDAGYPCLHVYIHILHYITFHYIPLHYIPLHYIPLHYIHTYRHTHTHRQTDICVYICHPTLPRPTFSDKKCYKDNTHTHISHTHIYIIIYIDTQLERAFQKSRESRRK